MSPIRGFLHDMEVANVSTMLEVWQRRRASIPEEKGGVFLNLIPDGPAIAKMWIKLVKASWSKLTGNYADFQPEPKD